MTCQEVHATIMSNKDRWTNAVVGAMILHIRSCRSCRELIDRNAALQAANRSADETASAQLDGVMRYHRAKQDPESGLGD